MLDSSSNAQQARPSMKRAMTAIAYVRAALMAFLALAALCSLPAWAENASNSNTSPRAAAHDGYGRMVFDWTGPVTYSADVINGELVLRFDRPVSGDFRNLLKPLSRYLRTVSVSSDRRTATFPLTRPIGVKAYTNSNGAVIVDLSDLGESVGSGDEAPVPTAATAAALPSTEGSGDGAPRPQPTGKTAAKGDKKAAAASEAPTPLVPAKPAPAPAAAPASDAPAAVEVRAADHGGFERVVFGWPKAVDYKLEKQPGKAILSFAKPSHMDLAEVKGQLPADMSVASADSKDGKTVVTLNVPADARLRHYASGGKVVLDVVRSGETRPGAANPTASLPLQSNEVAPPALQPLKPEAKPSLPTESLPPQKPEKEKEKAKPAEHAAPEHPAPEHPGSMAMTAPAAMTAAAPKPEHAPSPAPAPAAAEPPKVEPAAPPPKVEEAPHAAFPAIPTVERGLPSGPDDKIFSLSLSWDRPAAAAVFQRAGYLWVVFDRHQEVDTKLLQRLGGEAVSSVEQLHSKDGTVLRLVVQPGYNPSVRQDGLLWIVDLAHQPAIPRQPMKVEAPAVTSYGPGMVFTVPEATTMLSVQDPEVGDSMVVIPVMPLGAGVYPGRTSPDVDVLPTVQGIALVPHLEGIDIRPSRSGVTLSMTGGMRLSPSPKGENGKSKEGYFNVSAWKLSGPDSFSDESRVIQENLVELPANKKAKGHMEAARFMFSNGYAAEAIGYLKMAAQEEPSLLENGAYHALLGACNASMERWDLAKPELDNPLIQDDPEALFWRAAAHAGPADDMAPYAKAMAAGLKLVGDYPKPLQWPLVSLAARAALAAGDDATVQDALKMLDRLNPNPQQMGLLDYLHGAYGEMSGHFDKALYYYDKAINGDNREFRARANMASIELQLKMKRIKPKEAIDGMDRLRFAWRDESFEFNLLRRLAELQIAAGDYPNALRAARSLATNYPDNKDIGVVTKMMSDTFDRLYLQGGADAMPPISAIALYDEFRDLTPTGAKGDEMIRKLADRLASVDLLDRAAELLKHQVEYRLQGLDKARVGAQLALVDLLDHNGAGAVEALQSSAMDGLPAELQLQRKHLMARSLAEMDRVPDAIKSLDGDSSPEAGLLRAEIYWRKQDWPNAAAAFEGLVPRPERGATLDDASARLIINWATALTLANDDRGLASLRRAFGPSMTDTPYREGFSLLTSADREVSDLPALRAKIKEAQGFLNFMSNYRKRMQSSGLSAIN